VEPGNLCQWSGEQVSALAGSEITLKLELETLRERRL
jgi:hypothetical protein